MGALIRILKGFKKRDDELCHYCGVDGVAHTLCLRQVRRRRETVDRAVSNELTFDTQIPLLLQSEDFWKHIESFFTIMIRRKYHVDVESAATEKTHKNRIEACFCCRSSWADRAALPVERGIFHWKNYS